jgi:hypothetical protein
MLHAYLLWMGQSSPTGTAHLAESKSAISAMPAPPYTIYGFLTHFEVTNFKQSPLATSL